MLRESKERLHCKTWCACYAASTSKADDKLLASATLWIDLLKFSLVQKMQQKIKFYFFFFLESLLLQCVERSPCTCSNYFSFLFSFVRLERDFYPTILGALRWLMEHEKPFVKMVSFAAIMIKSVNNFKKDFWLLWREWRKGQKDVGRNGWKRIISFRGFYSREVVKDSLALIWNI